MRISIMLEGRGGILDMQTIDVSDHASAANVSKAIRQAMECWQIEPGDVIRIEDDVS